MRAGQAEDYMASVDPPSDAFYRLVLKLDGSCAEEYGKGCVLTFGNWIPPCVEAAVQAVCCDVLLTSEFSRRFRTV